MSFPSSATPVRIVLIEDYVLLRELLGAFIRDLPDHEIVAECATLADGMAACRSHRPGLVVLEWSMPDGTGESLLASLAQELPDTRWLILCTRQNGHGAQSALGLGAHGLLMKQSGTASLRAALERIRAGGTYYCPHSSNLLLDTLRTRLRPNRDGLTDRELEVLRHYASGVPVKMIADRMGISPKTVQNQVSSIRQKLGIAELAGLVRYAIRMGLDA